LLPLQAVNEVASCVLEIQTRKLLLNQQAAPQSD
jgi:hypothetical protein